NIRTSTPTPAKNAANLFLARSFFSFNTRLSPFCICFELSTPKNPYLLTGKDASGYQKFPYLFSLHIRAIVGLAEMIPQSPSQKRTMRIDTPQHTAALERLMVDA